MTRLALVPLTLALLMLVGCTDDRKGIESPSDAVDLSSREMPLSLGRTVTLRTAAGEVIRIGLAEIPLSRHGGLDTPPDATTSAELLMAACIGDANRASGSPPQSDASVPFEAQDLIYDQHPIGLSSQVECPALDHLEVSWCLAKWASVIADSVDPTYIVGISEDIGQRFPVTWATHPDTVALRNTGPLIIIDPPSESERASWALFATDMYRTAAYVAGVIATICDTELERSVIQGAFVERRFGVERRLQLGDLLAERLEMSLTGMMDASERAQEYIIGAAEAKRVESDGDPTPMWRGGQDSRLECASVFAMTDGANFEHGRMRPLVRMSREGSEIATTAPSYGRFKEAGYAPGDVLGWVYPPAGIPWGMPASARPLWTVRRIVGGRTEFLTTAEFSERDENRGDCSPDDEDAGCVVTYRERLEGYVLTQVPENQGSKRVARTMEGTQTRLRVLETMSGPGQEGVVEAFHVLAAPPAGRFPVVTQELAGVHDRLAIEALVRSGANPCLDEEAPVCVGLAREPSGALTSLTQDVERFFSESQGEPTSIADLGFDATALARAARRLSQVHAVTGQPLVRLGAARTPLRLDLVTGKPDGDLDGFQLGSPTALDAGGSFTTARALLGPTSPWYLRALANGSAESIGQLFVANTDSGNLGPLYPFASVYHALDWFRGEYERGAFRSKVSGRARRILDRTYTWASGLVPARAFVVSEVDALEDEEPSLLKVSVHLPLSLFEAGMSDTGLRNTVDAWLGEAGLLCAGTGGEMKGIDCDAYRFSEASWRIDDHKDVAVVGLGDGGASDLPRAVSSYAELEGRRVYLTSVADGVPGVFFAFTVAKPHRVREGETGRGVFTLPVPVSQALLDDLSLCIGADPEAPEEPQQACFDPGLVKLEDELSEAFTGADEIESSFVYYLDLAEQAARRADALGEELIRQGLEIEERAEKARERLQQICGSAINVPEWFCSDDACDLEQELAKLGDDTQYASLAECLGTSSTVWATLGHEPICVWRYRPDLPVCTCPEGALDCPGYCAEDDDKCEGPSRKSGGPPLCGTTAFGASCTPEGLAPSATMPCCDGSAPDVVRGEVCGAAGWERDDSPTNRFFESCRLGLASRMRSGRQLAEGVEFRLVGTPLGITRAPSHLPKPRATEDKSAARAALGPREACAELSHLREGSSTYSVEEVLAALDMASLKAAAQELGVRRAPLNIGAVTRLGGIWASPVVPGKLTLSGTSYSFEVPGGFPCAYDLPKMDPTAPDPPRSDWGSNRALRYGIECDGSDVQMLRGLGERLAMATELLRQISGGGLEGIEVSSAKVGPDGSLGQRTERTEVLRGGGRTHDTERVVEATKEDYLIPLNEKEGMKYSPAKWTRMTEGYYGDLPYLYAASTFQRGKSCNQSEAMRLLGLRYSAFDTGLIETQDMEVCYGPASWGPELERVLEHLVDHGTYYLSEGRSVTASIQAVCLDAERPGVGDGLQVPRCERDRRGRKQFFVDAGQLATWPSLSGEEQAELWDGRQRTGAVRKMLAHALRHPEAMEDTLDVPLLVDGQPATVGVWGTARSYPALSNYTFGNLLDATELACRTLEPLSSSVSCEDGAAEDITTMQDLRSEAAVNECYARRIRDSLAATYIAGLPQVIAEAFANKTTVDVSQAFGGEFATHAGALQNSLISLATHAEAVADIISEDGYALAGLEAEIAALSGEAEALAKQQATLLKVARRRCGQSIANALASAAATVQSMRDPNSVLSGKLVRGLVAIGLQLSAAGFACGADLKEAREEKKALASEIEGVEHTALARVLETSERIIASQERIQQSVGTMETALNEARSAIAALQRDTNDARTAALSVLLLQSDPESGRAAHADAALRARFNGVQRRYQEALRDAKKLAGLALRAVEQRLGVKLAEIDEPMSLVEAPSTWVPLLCSMTGIDYARIRESGVGDRPGDTAGPAADPAPRQYDYADGFIGDWVEKLRLAVESYRIDFPSQDGTDLAVLSLRDDIKGAVVECQQPGSNLLRSSAKLVASTAWEASCDQESCVAAGEVHDAPWTFPASGDPEGMGTRSAGSAAPVRLVHDPSVRVGPSRATSALPLEGLAVHLKAGTARGAVVGRWESDVLSGTAAVQDDPTRQPRAGRHEGRATLRFDGVDDALSLVVPGSVSSYTAVFVAAFEAAPQPVPSQSVLWSTPGGGVRLARVQQAPLGMLRFDPAPAEAAGRVDVGPGPSFGPFHVIVTRVDSDRNEVQLFVNGDLRGTTPWGGGEASLDGVLGCAEGLPVGECFRGHLAEVALYGRALSDKEVQGVQSHLAAHYYGGGVPQPDLWLRAEQCGTDGGRCPDVTGSGGSIRQPAAAAAPALVSSALGGRAGLLLEAGARLEGEASSTRTGATLALVTLVPEGAGTVSLWSGRSIDDTTTEIVASVPDRRIVVRQRAGAGTGEVIAESSGLAVGRPFVLSLRADTDGVALYVDGALADRTQGAIREISLSSVLGSGEGAIVFGELLGFSEALDPRGLGLVHAYLGGRYGIDMVLDPRDSDPSLWLRADHCAAQGAECEDLSGMGRRLVAEGGAGVELEGQPLNGRPGIVLSPGGRLAVADVPSDTERESFTAMFVGAWDGGSAFTLWEQDLGASDADGSAATDAVRLAIEQGELQFSLVPPGEGVDAAPLTAPIVAGVPFVVVVRGDASGRSLWVDGDLAAWDRVPVTALRIAGESRVEGSTSSATLARNVLAEAMLFSRALDAQDMVAIHRYVAARYGLALQTSTMESPLLQIARAGYVQRVKLAHGPYLLSWFERSAGTDCEPLETSAVTPVVATVSPTLHALGSLAIATGSVRVSQRSCDGGQDAAGDAGAGTGECEPQLNRCWTRFHTTLEVPTGVGEVAVGFAPSSGQSVVLAGPQLERASSRTSEQPDRYVATTGAGIEVPSWCPDEDGVGFRSHHWTERRCEALCSSGAGEECTNGAAIAGERCYWETTFSIPLEQLEAGTVLSSAGLSKGNFNYRIDNVALNVVGESLLDCEQPDAGPGCWSRGFVQYSLLHAGPFRVRNHAGDLYEAPLNVGRIQQAKALAAERYITNPVRTGDRELLTDYWDGELRGRPLDGTFRLRIYERPGFDWNRVQDVQLILDYRYWTRQ